MPATLVTQYETSDWTPLSVAPSAVTYNGNRSYTLTTSDYSGFISAGMRLRTTRTVAAPTQCTSLNGTSQSFSKSSPSGVTFTGNWTAMAWVKLSAYPAASSAIIGRDSAAGSGSGWEFDIDTSGRLSAYWRNASGASLVTTYQNIPLNQWVHVAVSVNAATPSSTVFYIDGVVASATTALSTATTVVQASTSLTIGNRNSVNNYLGGKFAQVALFSTNLSQATIQGYISQGLAGTESNLISAYSFNNSINDLNTTNANNLTANGSADATNADSPFGGQASGSISSTLDYAYITAVTSSSITVTVTKLNTIPTSGGLSAASYSGLYRPYGFPTTDSDSLLVKVGRNYSTFNPANSSDQDLASQGLVFNFYVPRQTVVHATVSVGVSSTTDFELQPQIKLDGTSVSNFTPAASLGGGASSRAQTRTFSTAITVSSGNHTISAGLTCSAGTGLTIQSNGSYISAVIPGEGTY